MVYETFKRLRKQYQEDFLQKKKKKQYQEDKSQDHCSVLTLVTQLRINSQVSKNRVVAFGQGKKTIQSLYL